MSDGVSDIDLYVCCVFAGDATLSRNAGIELSQLKLNARIGDTHGGEVHLTQLIPPP